MIMVVKKTTGWKVEGVDSKLNRLELALLSLKGKSHLPPAILLASREAVSAIAEKDGSILGRFGTHPELPVQVSMQIVSELERWNRPVFLLNIAFSNTDERVCKAAFLAVERLGASKLLEKAIIFHETGGTHPMSNFARSVLKRLRYTSPIIDETAGEIRELAVAVEKP